ncbi:DUF3486 family protein [Methylocaldum szegediense]|uniref:DUF3486 family protein n=1 Tax=Methylocaldum szegediense TaxID=73780 RepID=UPI0004013E77|nr:DUF3486 family protein [Methylocaldum szegediense]
MGRPSKIDKSLPADLRRELVRRILSVDEPSKPALRSWLDEQGFTFPRSTFNRYVNKVRGALASDGLPLQFRPAPEELPTTLILQEIGALAIQEDAIRARKLALSAEVERRRRVVA